jgi:Zn-dependent protease/predicted transcriptional regulator
VRDSLSLGRVAGIRIGMNWSVLALLALMVWTLAVNIFPDTDPGLGSSTHFAMAVAASLLFFASIVLHELGHALQARRDGMQIDGITLWLFGGVARFTGRFPSAGAEFRIAVAGPLVSLALGGAFLGISFVPGLGAATESVAFYLGYVNLLLLAFNLLPALPLDGGRMLRAALWRWRRDFGRATRTAASASRAIAYGVIGLGIALFFLQSPFSGVWLAFIGWFLLQAAGAESRLVDVGAALGNLRARDLMSTDLVAAEADATVERFVAERHWGRRLEAYPVLGEDGVVGLLETHRLAEVPQEGWAARRVRDLMVPRGRIPVLAPGDDLSRVDALFRPDGAHHALVVEDGHVVGLVSAADVVRALERRGVRVQAPPTPRRTS